MGSLTKYVASAMGKASFREAWAAGGWKVLIDGNLAETLIEHGAAGDPAVLVGTDQHGNKYFEKRDAQLGRNRFVVYAKASHYRTQDPSAVPPEWHGWLHHITNETPTNTEFNRPVYALEATQHPSFSGGKVHQPKGSWGNPERVTWRKYQPWTPPAGA